MTIIQQSIAVYFWRSLASILWSAFCLPVILMMFLLFSGFSVSHPFQWLYDTVLGIACLQFCIALLVLTISITLVAWFSLPHYKVVPEIDNSPLISVLGLLRWTRLPLMVISCLAGAVTAWAVSKLMGNGFTSLTHVVDTKEYERVVLNELHLFVVLGGIFAGLSNYRQFFNHHQNYLAFSNVQRFKLFQVRSEASSLLCTSIWQSLHTVKYFYILYFLLGGLPKSWIQTSFSISIDPSVIPLNSVVGLLSLTLFWQSFLSTLLIMFSWSLARSFLKIFHTEHLEFPIASVMEHDKSRSLPEALACSYSPLLQHIAFLDLSRLSKFSPVRRQELLSLSQPGGYPRNWTSVSVTALAVLRELSDLIRQDNWAIMSKVSVSAHKSNVYPGAGAYSRYNYDASSMQRHPGHDTTTHPESPDGTQDGTKGSLLLTKVQEALKSLPFVSHLLAETPDVSSRRLFASCQLQIWAVEGLSHIAAKSFVEDKYGVVQSSLPTIFGVLLDLHEAIEKHFKLTTSAVRRPASPCDNLSDALLRYKLHAVNKAAIYRVVDVYRQHLDDLRLSPEYMKKLQPFIDYNL